MSRRAPDEDAPRAAFHRIEPEVAGGFGVRAHLDTSVHPPRVERLHLTLDGWLGDPLLECFPCFVATEALAGAMDAAGLSGVAWAEAEVDASPLFDDLHPGRAVPRWRWLRAVGHAGREDVGLDGDARLVVSARTLALLREAGTRHAIVEPHRSGAKPAAMGE